MSGKYLLLSISAGTQALAQTPTTSAPQTPSTGID